jgi:Ca2+-binding EF-hand superfamily protein
MLTDFQKKKLTTLFKALDMDKNGVMERSDYETIAKNLAAARGKAPGSPEYQTIYSKQMATWNQVRAFEDKKGTGKVSLEGWFKFHDQMLSQPGMFDAVVKMTAAFLFDMLDMNGDGKIELDEYNTYLETHNVETGAWVPEVFDANDRNHDGVISREELLQVLDEFYRSDDPKAPGNRFYGPLP